MEILNRQHRIEVEENAELVRMFQAACRVALGLLEDGLPHLAIIPLAAAIEDVTGEQPLGRHVPIHRIEDRYEFGRMM